MRLTWTQFLELLATQKVITRTLPSFVTNENYAYILGIDEGKRAVFEALKQLKNYSIKRSHK